MMVTHSVSNIFDNYAIIVHKNVIIIIIIIIIIPTLPTYFSNMLP